MPVYKALVLDKNEALALINKLETEPKIYWRGLTSTSQNFDLVLEQAKK